MANTVSYKPHLLNNVNGYFLTKNDYEDLRINSVRSSDIRYWSITSGNLNIEQSFEAGRLNLLRIRELSENRIKELIYKRQGSALILVSAKVRNPNVHYFTGIFLSENAKEICGSKEDALSEIKKFKENLKVSSLENNLDSMIIDPSCENVMPEMIYERVRTSLVDAFKDGNSLDNCLGKEETFKSVAAKFKYPNIDKAKEDLDVLRIKFNLVASKFYNNPNTLKSKIKCQKSPDKKVYAQCVERKEITFFAGKDMKETDYPSLDEYRSITAHEIMHEIGVTDESAIGEILNICGYKYKSPQKNGVEVAMKHGAANAAISSPLDVETSMRKEGANTEVKIDKSMATKLVPETPTVVASQPFADSSNAIKEYAADPDGASERAYTRSVSTTTPILNFAKSALASFSTPALADGGSVRSTASSGRSTAVVAAASSVRDDDYKVKEEILLDSEKGNQQQVAKEVSGNSAVAKSKAAYNSVRGDSSKVSTNEVASGEGSAEVSVADGSSIARSMGVSGGSAGARAPSSLSNKPGYNPGSNSKNLFDRDELTTFLKNYDGVKKRLGESKFQESLKESKIQIVDLTGKVFGSSKPDIIYLDTGTSYVRNK